jgi:hypothetical protein
VEFLKVIFDEDRAVIVNSASGAWRTNKLLQFQAGTYVVTLALPLDFTPLSIPLVLKNTTVLTPKEITFTKVPLFKAAT